MFFLLFWIRNWSDIATHFVVVVVVVVVLLLLLLLGAMTSSKKPKDGGHAEKCCHLVNAHAASARAYAATFTCSYYCYGILFRSTSRANIRVLFSHAIAISLMSCSPVHSLGILINSDEVIFRWTDEKMQYLMQPYTGRTEHTLLLWTTLYNVHKQISRFKPTLLACCAFTAVSSSQCALELCRVTRVFDSKSVSSNFLLVEYSHKIFNINK